MSILNTAISLTLEQNNVEFPFFVLLSSRGVVIFDEVTSTSANQDNEFSEKSIPQGSITELSYYNDPEFSVSGIFVTDSKLVNMPESLRDQAIAASIGLNLARNFFSNPSDYALGSSSAQVRTLQSISANKESVTFVNPPIPADLLRYNEVLALFPRWYVKSVSISREDASKQINVSVTFISKLESLGLNRNIFNLVERFIF